ncbi:hypothetical protein SAMN04488023_111127 [Pedobacter rhizosphaerae]|uniref:Uncharacterized protein n=1 Tax=Pedobacter rhizosphaerae TaxID=390241 RepID=A0A1H9QBS3_9SPHI|nr:hypothetical protein SAMN04488023_111127 [Pedobacter rhizosphaerae]
MGADWQKNTTKLKIIVIEDILFNNISSYIYITLNHSCFSFLSNLINR